MKLKEYFTPAHITSLTCVISGLMYLYDFHDLSDIWSILDVISCIILLIGGTIVSVIKRPNIYLSSGLLGITLGLTITVGSSSLTTTNGLITFLLVCTVIVCGVLCVFFSISLYCGKKYNVFRMQVIFLIYIVITLIPLVYYVAILNINIFEAMIELRNNVIGLIVVISYFVLLNDPEIKYTTTNGKMANNANVISNIFLNDPNAYISREDLLSVTEVEDWTPVNEGPIVSENILPLTVGGKSAMLITHLWKDGRYMAEIVRSNRGTIIQSLRFEVVDIVIENDDPVTCPDITIYGNDGFFIRLLIKDNDTKLKKMSKSVRVLYRIIGY